MKDIRISNVWINLSWILVLLVAVSSLAGLFSESVYGQETANWRTQAIGQDLANLVSAAALALSTRHLARKSARAYLCWVGILLYMVYAFLIYAFFIHFNYLFLVYVAVLGLSVYSLVGGLAGQDLSHISGSLMLSPYAKPARYLLMAIGLLFGLLWLSEIVPAVVSGELPKSTADAGLWVNPVHVIDLSLVLPGMILTSVLMRRKSPLGFAFAVPWLVFSALMGLGIVFSLILNLYQGIPEAAVPLVLVGLIVIGSSAVLYLLLNGNGKR